MPRLSISLYTRSERTSTKVVILSERSESKDLRFSTLSTQQSALP